MTIRIALGGLCHGGDVVANRVANGFRVDIGIKTAREGLQHNPGKTRQKSVSKASGGILFVNDQWAA